MCITYIYMCVYVCVCVIQGPEESELILSFLE